MAAMHKVVQWGAPVLAPCKVCLKEASVSVLPIVSATLAPGAQVVLEGLDHVLMATGRKPNTRSLGLEEVGPSPRLFLPAPPATCTDTPQRD